MINNVKDNQNKSILINVKTWSRDSHGLYDYECNSTKNVSFTTKKDQQIIRKKNEVRLDTPLYKEEQDEENLGKVYVDQSSNLYLI
jgi:hypothetical protein